MIQELNDQDIQNLYSWIDKVKFSRPKKNLTRDFSDGVACAELIHHFLPKIIDLHNYSAAHSTSQKLYNWNTLNYKVFKKLGYRTSDEIIQSIVQMKPGYIEYLLYDLRTRIEQSSQNGSTLKLSISNSSSKLSDHSTPTSPEHVEVKELVRREVKPKRDPTAEEMTETIKILQLKIKKLEELLVLKDFKIQELTK